MELVLTSDQEFFADTTAKFLEDKASDRSAGAPPRPGRVHAGVLAAGRRLGWTSLLVSEDDGGGSISGAGVEDLALVAYEFGRHAAPGPLLPNNVVAGALSRSGSEEQKAEVLPGIVAGEVLASWCGAEPRPDTGLGRSRCPRRRAARLHPQRRQGRQSRRAPSLSSSSSPPAPRTASTQFLVPADAAGVTVTPMKSVDLTRRFAEVRFDDVEVPASRGRGRPGDGARRR